MYVKGQNTRSELIQKATELFSRYGFDGTTIDAIAIACGVTRAVPYRYFDNKRDLYLCCLERSFERFGVLPVGGGSKLSPRDDLEHYLLSLIELFATDALFRKLVVRSIMEDDQAIIDTLILRLFSRPVGDLAGRIKRVRPELDARTVAYSAISIIVIDLETRKFGSRLKPQPRNSKSTGALLRHVLSMIDHIV